MSDQDCDELVDMGTDLFEEVPFSAGEVFEKAGRCYDRHGDRKRSAQYYTLAGDCYLIANRMKKAEQCYAKAIIRNLTGNELEAAQVVLNKGAELGFETSYGKIMAKYLRLEKSVMRTIKERPLFR